MRHSLRLPRRPSAASGGEAFEAVRSPEPARLDSEEEAAALAQRVPAEVEGEGSLAAASGQNGDDGGPDWRDRFDTVEELYDRFVNVDRLRGRQANMIGQLRRQLRLAARLYDIAVTDRDAGKALAADTALRAILDPAAQEVFLETFERMITPDVEEPL